MVVELSDLYSFLAVCVITTFAISIGVGGGILYVPTLSRIYANISLGIYLSRIIVLVSSTSILSYHLYVDVSSEYKYYVSKKARQRSSDEPHDVENDVKLQRPKPRVSILLAVAVIPWSMTGSYLGTLLHTSARDYLKIFFTLTVSVILAVTLYRIVRECIANRRLPTTPTLHKVIPHTSQDCSPDVNNTNERNKNVFNCIKYLEPYTVANASNITTRIIGFLHIVTMIVCYYFSLVLTDILYISILRSYCLLIGTFYLIKIRILMIDPQCTDNIPSEKENLEKCKFRGFLHKCCINGIFHILGLVIASFVIGILSGCVGIGGGIIVLPSLQILKLTPISCSATSSIMTVIVATISTLNFTGKVNFNYSSLLIVIGASVLGTLFSVSLIKRFIRDKSSNMFINVVLSSLCSLSIVLTWLL